MTAAGRRKVVTWAREAAGLSERKACRLFGVSRSTVQYRSVRPADRELRARLKELAEERGDWEKAAEYYARFVELWVDADPELQPRVQAAQQRLEEILAERG